MERQIADDLDPFLVRIALQLHPLLFEYILRKGVKGHFFTQLLLGLRQCLLIPKAQRLRPFVPGRAVITVLERHVQRMILDLFLLLETQERLILRYAAARKRQMQQMHAGLIQPSIIHTIAVDLSGRQIIRIKPPVLRQLLQREEIRISRSQRERLIRRIAITGHPERQDLPDPLRAALQLIHKMICRAVQCADPIRRGQG